MGTAGEGRAKKRESIHGHGLSREANTEAAVVR